MKATGAKIDAFDCMALAEKAGSTKTVNLVLLGRLSKYFDAVDFDAWMKAIEETVPERLIEMNKKAFKLGRES